MFVSVYDGHQMQMIMPAAKLDNAQNPLHTFPRNFPVDGEFFQLATDLLRTSLLATRPTSWQQVVVMEFGNRHDTTDTTDFCPRQLVTDLLWTCYEWGNWCNRFWPLPNTHWRMTTFPVYRDMKYSLMCWHWCSYFEKLRGGHRGMLAG